jgi:hypothetical protein
MLTAKNNVQCDSIIFKDKIKLLTIYESVTTDFAGFKAGR